MLQNLTNLQVERALAWLADPEWSNPPDELVSLSQIEWFLLDRMLESLMLEKQQSPLQ